MNFFASYTPVFPDLMNCFQITKMSCSLNTALQDRLAHSLLMLFSRVLNFSFDTIAFQQFRYCLTEIISNLFLCPNLKAFIKQISVLMTGADCNGLSASAVQKFDLCIQLFLLALCHTVVGLQKSGILKYPRQDTLPVTVD